MIVPRMYEEMECTLQRFGGVLRCNCCNNEIGINQISVGNSLAHGWPKCCGQTMEWVTEDQLAGKETHHELDR